MSVSSKDVHAAATSPSTPPARAGVLLSLHGIHKRYGETVALRDVSLELTPGRVHGLVGENGAGKSTLVKIMSGLEVPDSGDVRFSGAPVAFRSPREALEMGISTVYQELTLAPKLSVAENLLMGWQPSSRRKAYRSHLALDALAGSIMHEWELDDIPSYLPVQRLSLGDQQRLEIVRACARAPRLLILDEPTAALGGPAVEWLARQIERLTAAGTCVVYISHRLDEVRSSCSDVTVLRDGRNVGTVDNPREVPARTIVRLIAGREVDQLVSRDQPEVHVDAPVELRATSLSVGTALCGVNLELRSGEILGVAGLEGSGQRELFLALFGVAPIDGGELVVHERRVRLRSPKDAVAAGIALVPEDRKAGGLLLESSNVANVALASLGRFRRLGLFQARAARRLTADLFQSLGVKYSSVDVRVGALSGGNQQKVVLAKWLAAGSRIYLMYDPTRGVDPATKIDMYAKLRELAGSGSCILLYSSELEELLNLSTRMLVMYKGRIVREYAGAPFDGEEVVSAMLGIGA